MAAKHDGKHARANMWVTHQNLARAKGGRPPPQFKERKVAAVPRRMSATSAPLATPAPGEGSASSPPVAAACANDEATAAGE